jgi:Txe/YoeB family toxin of Txe-Axe toxin-antitoxin module
LKKIEFLNYLQIFYSSRIDKQHKLVYLYLLFIGGYG